MLILRICITIYIYLRIQCVLKEKKNFFIVIANFLLYKEMTYTCLIYVYKVYISCIYS